jgi:hypothetical protein
MEDASSLTDTNSRTEQHIAYLTNQLGLDRPMAAMLHRGERLQEKGQLQQAVYYFERVLEEYPDCSEASENLRIVKTLLKDIKVAKSIQVIPETTSSHLQPVNVTTTEMEVTWSGRVDSMIDYFPYANKWAVDEAERRLREIGYGDSLLKMICNNTITNKKTWDTETGWVTYLEGKALFQVRLIPATDSDECLEFTVSTAFLEENTDPIQSVVQQFQDPDSHDLHENKREEANNNNIDPTQHRIQRNDDSSGTPSMGLDVDESMAWIFMDAEEEGENFVLFRVGEK